MEIRSIMQEVIAEYGVTGIETETGKIISRLVYGNEEYASKASAYRMSGKHRFLKAFGRLLGNSSDVSDVKSLYRCTVETYGMSKKDILVFSMSFLRGKLERALH